MRLLGKTPQKTPEGLPINSTRPPPPSQGSMQSNFVDMPNIITTTLNRHHKWVALQADINMWSSKLLC